MRLRVRLYSANLETVTGRTTTPPGTHVRQGSGRAPSSLAHARVRAETGAQGPLLERVLGRSVTAPGGSAEDWSRALFGAFCVCADMTHAVHPNYAERHDPGHCPLPNGGPAVVDVNQRYATDGTGMAVITAACERAGGRAVAVVRLQQRDAVRDVDRSTDRGPAGCRDGRRGGARTFHALGARAVRGGRPWPSRRRPGRLRDVRLTRRPVREGWGRGPNPLPAPPRTGVRTTRTAAARCRRSSAASAGPWPPRASGTARSRPPGARSRTA